jgi:hypothetical protein
MRSREKSLSELSGKHPILGDFTPKNQRRTPPSFRVEPQRYRHSEWSYSGTRNPLKLRGFLAIARNDSRTLGMTVWRPCTLCTCSATGIQPSPSPARPGRAPSTPMRVPSLQCNACERFPVFARSDYFPLRVRTSTFAES